MRTDTANTLATYLVNFFRVRMVVQEVPDVALYIYVIFVVERKEEKLPNAFANADVKLVY